MSKIQDLIDELCPDGVEFHPISQIFNMRNGYTPSKNNDNFWNSEDIPWFRMEDIRANGNILEDSILKVSKSALKKNGPFEKNSIIVATSATIGEHALIETDFLCNQRFTALTLKSEFREKFNIKFIYYYCFVLDEWCKRNTTTSSFSSVDMVGFKNFKFPMPPLKIQEEVVRILDRFTLLEAELEAELEARRKQYAHYRDSLLFSDKIKYNYLNLSEVGVISTGKTPSKLESSAWSEGINFVTPSDIRNGQKYISSSERTVRLIQK